MHFEFEWDGKKCFKFRKAQSFLLQSQEAFYDPNRLIIKDEKHSGYEERFFCIGQINRLIATVRFTVRSDEYGERIRIFGAVYWRKGKTIYETHY